VSVTVAIDARPLAMANTGVAHYLRLFAGALVEAGFAVTLVTDGPPATDDPVVQSCRLDVLPTRPRNVWEQVTLLRYLRRNDFDVHVAGWNVGLPLLWRGRTRLCAIVYDLIPLQLPHLYRRPDRRAAYRLALGVTLRKADAVVTISESTRDDVRREGYDGPLLDAPVPVRIAGEARRDAERPYLLYVGGHDPRKRLRELVAAFARFHARHPEYRLVLVGRSVEALAPDVRTAGVPVELAGYVSEKAKAELMAGATAMVFPSLYEGYGLPVAEAIAYDLPVVTGTQGSLREVAGDAAVYADPTDPESLARAMEEVLDPAVRARLAAARPAQRERNAHPAFERDVAEFLRSVAA
jgi:glycosyltransferase involved in cell wall biosynthesis